MMEGPGADSDADEEIGIPQFAASVTSEGNASPRLSLKCIAIARAIMW
jgi:hypothetical protein